MSKGTVTKSFWKIELEVTEELIDALKALAARTGKTQPELLRQAVQEFVSRNQPEIPPRKKTQQDDTERDIRKMAAQHKMLPSDFEDALLDSESKGETKKYVQDPMTRKAYLSSIKSRRK
jgi:hypothetical protein